MSLVMQDIVDMDVGDILLKYNKDDGWCKVVVLQKGLNYVELKWEDLPQPWKETIDGMLIANRYAVYIPERRKRSWLILFIRKMLIRILRTLSIFLIVSTLTSCVVEEFDKDLLIDLPSDSTDTNEN